MFRKVKAKKEKKLELSVEDVNEDEQLGNKTEKSQKIDKVSELVADNTDKSDYIEKIKTEIESRLNKPKQKGMVISKNDLRVETNTRDDNKNNSVKKVFLSESVIENAKSPEELKKILGTNREEIYKIQIEKRKKLREFQRDMFTLPETLNVIKENNDDHVDNIVKLSAAGKYIIHIRVD